MHPIQAGLFVPRPDPSGCPDFRGKVIAFAGLGKLPASYDQYAKEAVLVLGCNWSAEMHKGVDVLVNCLPYFNEDSHKIKWTCVWSLHGSVFPFVDRLLRYHHAPDIPVVTSAWLDAVSSTACTVNFSQPLAFRARFIASQ